jgi:sigma-B regulation protein RsbU (phosphoserine phosphatase)
MSTHYRRQKSAPPAEDQETPAAQSDLKKRLESLKKENQQLRGRLAEMVNEQTREANQALRLAEYIIDHSPAILFRRLAAEKLDDRKMVYVSPNISRFGYKAEDLLSNKMMFRDILYQEDAKRIQKEIEESVEEERRDYSQYYRIITSSGELRWVEDRTSVVEDDQGVRYHQGIVIDIHERKEAEEKLRKSEEKYRQIVETTCEGFVLLDTAMQVLDLNTAFARMMGQPMAELIGSQPFESFENIDSLLTSAHSGNSETGDFHELEGRLESADGSFIPVLIHANSLRGDQGDSLGLMAFVTDISEHKKALMLAGEVQKSLLPGAPPVVSGFDICGQNIACDEVGGDYYDYLGNGSPENFAVVVGDISGHGVDSALLMSSARAFLRMRASQPGNGSEIISSLNRHLCADVDQSGHFMTMFYLHFNQDMTRPCVMILRTIDSRNLAVRGWPWASTPITRLLDSTELS